MSLEEKEKIGMDLAEGENTTTSFRFERKIFQVLVEQKEIDLDWEMDSWWRVFPVVIDGVYYTQNNMINPDLKS